MSAPALSASDAELLARYLREGCEASFGALVAAHQRMVLGAAVRRTGDVELARDVAQQVFALLARKAAWLAGRESLAGWLHQAASYLGARAVRSEARARARHEALAREGAGVARDAAHWTALDESLAALGAKEREALVLHYFEDRSYAEMATALGVSEAAARQRVSRALRGLGARLRRRGIGASAAALLTGGAALQSTVPAQAGLAAAALSTSASTAPAALLLTTIMSHTAAKLAVAAIVLAALPVAILQRTHGRLVVARAAQDAAPSRASTPPMSRGASQISTASGGEVLAAWEQLRAEQARRVQAEEKLAALQRKVERVETEVVVSYGQVEDLARKVSAKFRQIREFKKRIEQADVQDRARLAQQFGAQMTDFGELYVVEREAQKMESEPEKVARFYATMVGELAGLDEAGREPLVRVARDRFVALARAGLVAAQRPQSEDSAWLESRRLAFGELEAEMLAALPPERKEEAESLGEIFKLTGGDPRPQRVPGEPK